MISFVHLSDLHFSNKNNILLKKKDDIINSIYNNICMDDYAFIITSGDLAFSGNYDEYYQLMNFYDALQEKLKSEKIKYEFLFVPGNHDCDFSIANIEVRDALLKSNNSGIGILNQLKDVQKNFDNFIDLFPYSNLIYSHPLLSIQSTTVNNQKYNFFLFNTSLFSQKNEQYGSLQFPQDIINNIEQNVVIHSNDVNIAIMHHPSHWFNNEDFHNITRFIENNMNFIFSGHEHMQNDYSRITNTERHIQIFEGSEFSNQNKLNQYNIYKIGQDNQTSKHLQWNGFNFEEKENTRPITISQNGIHPSHNILTFLNDIKLLPNINEKIKLADIFVPPYITTHIKNEDDSNKTLSKLDTDDILNNTLKNKFLLIKGDARYGKTSLLKMIYTRRVSQHFYPIYIDIIDYSPSKLKDLEHLVTSCFEEQYDNATKGIYNTFSKENKVILIDNIDYDNKIKDIPQMLLNLSKIASEIIVTSSSSFNEALLFNNKKASEFFDTFKFGELTEWNRTKKIELFSKWLENSNSNADAGAIENLEKNLNVPFRKGMLPSIPFYLLSSLHLAQNGVNLSGASPETGCAEFYKTIINLSLLNIGIPKNKLSACLNFIENIAKEILFSDIKCISQKSLLEFANTYVKTKMLQKLPIEIEELVKANILTQQADGYCFAFDYIYYFFAASYITNNMSKDEVKEKLTNILNHLYTRENANIAIFVSYHSKESFIIESVQQKAQEIIDYFNQRIEENISWDHIDFINDLVEELPKLIEPAHTGMELKKREAKLLDDEEEKLKTIDDDDKENKAMEALKLSEIIGCLLKNHAFELDAEPKKHLCRYGYLLHKAILSSYIDMLKKDKDGLLKYIEKQINENVKEINSENIRKESNKIIFYITSLMYLGTAIHLTSHLANYDLLPVNSALCNDEKLQSKFMEIIDLYNYIQYEHPFPYTNKLQPLLKKIENKEHLFKLIITLFTLRYISINYNNIDRAVREGIFKLLNISNAKKTQLLIDSSKEKNS